MSDEEDAELLQVYLDEAREHLSGIEGDLLELETTGAPDPDLVNKVFRAVHSVKGGAGFFGLESIKTLSHAMENVLGQMRKSELAATPEVIGVLLKSADSLVRMLDNPAASNQTDVTGFTRELESMSLPTAPLLAVERTESADTHTTTANTREDAASAAAPAPSTSTTTKPLAAPSAVSNPLGTSPNESASLPEQPRHKPAPTAGETSIRVQVGILDRLMTLAGELVLTRNQLLESHETNSKRGTDATQRIDHITTELQDAIMSTRMQSIGMVFQKFRRVVRDLASSLGKEVDLTIEGEEVELDRSIIEAIGDPLTHLVRNSLDHGIERPEIRLAQNKPRRGTLRLSAFHKAGQVIIEIADDGAGIDPAKVRAKALEKGLCTKDQLASMSENAIVKLIFRPGFSTATEVTEVSGRGVGMDVVHSNLSRLGGVVDVQSAVGAGSLMRIKLPLTLAIIPCLLVAEEGEIFAIPQASLIELHRIPAQDARQRVRKFGDVLVLHLRGELIPLIRLRDVLGIPSRTFATEADTRALDQRETGFDRRQEPSSGDAERRRDADRRHSHRGAVNIAIVAAGDFRYGIMVENLLDSLEIVVKPLGRHLRHCDSYAGATILGDGRLALILDVVSMARRLQSADGNEALASAKAAAPKTVDSTDRMTLILVENSGDELMAIPLGLIERIERLRRDDMQHVGGRRTLTYRGHSLPLLAVEEVVQIKPCRDQASVYAVVYRSHEREVGLIVSDLIDIIDSSAELDELTHRQPGVFGSLLVDGRVTLLLDIHGIARDRLGIPAPAESGAPKRTRTVLVVDDSRFFRERITEFNREAGFEVVTAEDGVQGLDALDRHAAEIDLVITDIEMPHLDGFEFTRRLRADARFKHLPVIAVTSLMGEEAEKRGQQAGISEYMIKLDRERIMDRVNYYLRAHSSSNQWSAA